ncbi:MAG: hypothetical protein WD016_09255 [Balneolaceae bacterium]
MNKYWFLSLIWLLPGYMCFLVFQQAMVYTSTIDTYENGTTYMAEVTDFDIKQIAAQSNGYIDIKFEVADSVIERRLSLSIQMAQRLMETTALPIRYQQGAFQEIVLFPVYSIQKSTSLINMGVAFITFGITLAVAFFVQRFAFRRMKNEHEEDFEIELVD